MVHFQTGKKLHSLSKYQQPPPIDDTTGWPIHEVFWGLRMTADGKYLMAFDRGLKRFRFEGEDLIYEVRGKDLIGGRRILRRQTCPATCPVVAHSLLKLLGPARDGQPPVQ
ncbi:MAG: hypothetical protein ACK6CT_13895 [Planctomycetia bacterium]